MILATRQAAPFGGTKNHMVGISLYARTRPRLPPLAVVDLGEAHSSQHVRRSRMLSTVFRFRWQYDPPDHDDGALPGLNALADLNTYRIGRIRFPNPFHALPAWPARRTAPTRIATRSSRLCGHRFDPWQFLFRTDPETAQPRLNRDKAQLNDRLAVPQHGYCSDSTSKVRTSSGGSTSCRSSQLLRPVRRVVRRVQIDRDAPRPPVQTAASRCSDDPV